MALSVARSPCPVTGSLCTLRDSSKSARALRSTPGHMKITEVFRVRRLAPHRFTDQVHYLHAMVHCHHQVRIATTKSRMSTVRPPPGKGSCDAPT